METKGKMTVVMIDDDDVFSTPAVPKSPQPFGRQGC